MIEALKGLVPKGTVPEKEGLIWNRGHAEIQPPPTPSILSVTSDVKQQLTVIDSEWSFVESLFVLNFRILWRHRNLAVWSGRHSFKQTQTCSQVLIVNFMRGGRVSSGACIFVAPAKSMHFIAPGKVYVDRIFCVFQNHLQHADILTGLKNRVQDASSSFPPNAWQTRSCFETLGWEIKSTVRVPGALRKSFVGGTMSLPR